jgi:hypothetical protein
LKSAYSNSRTLYLGDGRSDPKKVWLHGAGEFMIMAADYHVQPTFYSLVIPWELRSAWLLPGARECSLGPADTRPGLSGRESPPGWVDLR